MIKFNQDDKLLGMKSYRKKPVIVHAVLIVEEFEVETLEGTMRGKPGDYLIKGVRGELYPCDHEIFKEIYEEVFDED